MSHRAGYLGAPWRAGHGHGRPRQRHGCRGALARLWVTNPPFFPYLLRASLNFERDRPTTLTPRTRRRAQE
eukprot:3509559-Prymnesium_polylepis.1